MVDMASRIMPRRKAITPKVAVLLQIRMNATTVVVHAHLARGNLESITLQNRQRRRGDALRVNHPNISLVSHPRAATVFNLLASVFCPYTPR